MTTLRRYLCGLLTGHRRWEPDGHWAIVCRSCDWRATWPARAPHPRDGAAPKSSWLPFAYPFQRRWSWPWRIALALEIAAYVALIVFG